MEHTGLPPTASPDPGFAHLHSMQQMWTPLARGQRSDRPHRRLKHSACSQRRYSRWGTTPLWISFWVVCEQAQTTCLLLHSGYAHTA